jgi:hypothetical protein
MNDARQTSVNNIEILQYYNSKDSQIFSLEKKSINGIGIVGSPSSWVKQVIGANEAVYSILCCLFSYWYSPSCKIKAQLLYFFYKIASSNTYEDGSYTENNVP